MFVPDHTQFITQTIVFDASNKEGRDYGVYFWSLGEEINDDSSINLGVSDLSYMDLDGLFLPSKVFADQTDEALYDQYTSSIKIDPLWAFAKGFTK